jgi:tight adherence protein C
VPPELLAAAAGALGAWGLALLVAPLLSLSRWRRPSRGSATAGGGGRQAGVGQRLIRLLARAGGLLRPAAAPSGLALRLAAAGRPGGLGAGELLAAKLAAALAAAATGVPLSAVAPGRLGPALVLAAPVAGFLAPDAWLARRAGERARRARRELPALLDLLRVTIEAGASLPAALAAVGEGASGPVAAEWRAVGREVALGAPLSEALRELALRLPLPELRAFVAALERARRHGAPLADTLASHARDVRFTLRRRVQEEAARAGPKMQLVVAGLLVPSVLLLVAAALVAALIDAGGALPV